MPLSTAANGMPISPAMLTDPKELKKMTNGTTSPTMSHLNTMSARRNSEPPSTSNLITPPVVDFEFISSKDDAHHFLEEQGRVKKLAHPPIASQPPPARFDPRQLLDPKRFKPDLSPQNPQPSPDQRNMEPSQLNGVYKRDHVESEGQGQGSLIEQMHNVTNREERPVKKRKVEDNEFIGEDEQGKATFGGGKGGDLGQYLKEKRKEGQENLGPANAVVDLTGGECSLTNRGLHAKIIFR